MAHDLQVVAPKDLVDPTIPLLPIGLSELGRVILGGAIGPLSGPAEFRVCSSMDYSSLLISRSNSGSRTLGRSLETVPSVRILSS